MRKELLTICGWFFILSFTFFNSAKAQQVAGKSMEVRGTIVDYSGPLPGVSITVKNKQNIGTTTDLNGKFLLNVPENAVLVISMVGYDNQEIPVKGKEVINVTLKKANVNAMEDVVVVAYSK